MLVKSLTLFPAANVNGLELEVVGTPLRYASVDGLFFAPKEYPLLIGFAALMGLARGLGGGGMRSSVDEGGDGGVEKARPPCVSSLPPIDALRFLGLARAPCDVLGRSGRGTISVMGRSLGAGFVLCFCFCFAIVTSGDAISSSSSWKSQTLDSTGAVETLPSFDRCSGCALLLKCLLYVVILLRGVAPESGREVMIIVGWILLHGVATAGGRGTL